jgi:hypothetical protein
VMSLYTVPAVVSHYVRSVEVKYSNKGYHVMMMSIARIHFRGCTLYTGRMPTGGIFGGWKLFVLSYSYLPCTSHMFSMSILILLQQCIQTVQPLHHHQHQHLEWNVHHQVKRKLKFLIDVVSCVLNMFNSVVRHINLKHSIVPC